MTETNAYACSIAGQDYVDRVCSSRSPRLWLTTSYDSQTARRSIKDCAGAS